MTTRPELIRRHRELERAQGLLEKAAQMQVEIHHILEEVNALTGLELSWRDDLEDVGELEDLVEGRE